MEWIGLDWDALTKILEHELAAGERRLVFRLRRSELIARRTFRVAIAHCNGERKMFAGENVHSAILPRPVEGGRAH